MSQTSIRLLHKCGDVALASNCWAEAMESFSEALTIAKDQQYLLSDCYYKIILCLILQRNHQMAVKYINEALSLYPNNETMRSWLVYCSSALSNFSTASRIVNEKKEEVSEQLRISILFQNNQYILWETGNALSEDELYDGAIQYLRRSEFIESSSSGSSLLRAECLARTGRVEEALAIAEPYLTKQGSNKTQALLVQSLCQFVTLQLAQARDTFSKAVLSKKNDANNYKYKDVFNQMALFYGRAKRFEERCEYKDSVGVYSEMLKLYGKRDRFSAAIYVSRAEAYIMMGKCHLALKDCNFAVICDYNCATAYSTAGKCYREFGMLTKALHMFQWAYDIEPTELVENAITYIQNKDNRDVKPNYHKLLEVKRGCTNSEVHNAFRKLSILLHPDRSISSVDALFYIAYVPFEELNNARNYLVPNDQPLINPQPSY